MDTGLRLKGLAHSATYILLVTKQTPFKVTEEPKGAHPNRIQRHVTLYHFKTEGVLKNATPSTMSAGPIQVQPESWVNRGPVPTPYRSESIEKAPDRLIVFLNKDENGYYLAAPNAWEEAGKESEIAQLLSVDPK